MLRVVYNVWEKGIRMEQTKFDATFLQIGRLSSILLLAFFVLASGPSSVSAVIGESAVRVSEEMRAPSAAYSHILGNSHTQDANFTDLHNPGLFINESDTFLNKGTSSVTINIDSFRFYAKKIANPVTPVIVTVDGDDDFTVKAIGKTQSSYVLGANNLPFDDTVRTITLSPGEKIATGFIDADANGDGWGLGGNPIPAEANGNIGVGADATGLDQDEVWALLPFPLVEFEDGFVPDTDTPALVQGQKILTTNNGKSLGTYNLLRSYRYSIGLSSNDIFNGATLYTESGLTGTEETFSDGITLLSTTGIGAETVSSIKVEDGYVAYLCDGTASNTETCRVYTPGSFSVLFEWDDRATIVKVDQNDPARHGLWEDVYELPQRAIAAAQMPDGRVMFWQGGVAEGVGKEISIIDPITYTGLDDAGTTGAPNNHDTFCPGPALLPNGDLVLAGGGLGTEAASSVFYWDAYKWEREEDMKEPHYYGTSVTMADGRVFHALGSAVAANNYTADQSNTPEVWNGTTWDQLTGLDLSPLHADHGYYNSNYYPFLHLMPNSNLFHSGGVPTMHEINPNAQTIHNQGIRAQNDAYRHWGNALMIDEGLLFISGGRTDEPISNRTTVLIDINDELDIQSDYAADMHYDRAFHNMVQLPTGDVFVSGGNTSGKIFVDHGTVYPTELWDKDTNTWTETAELTTPRNYHSTSLLLPDGRIWQAGGDCGHCPNEGDFNHHFNMQLYSPPYLFNSDGTFASRPTIASYPTGLNGIKASDSFDVTVTGAGQNSIVDFNIIKMSSTTHQINTDVRRLSLDFTSNGGGSYEIEAHDNINVMTPGYWMLFAVNDSGVPSKAGIVHVSTEPGSENPIPKPKPIKIVTGNAPSPLGSADSWKSNLIINETDTYKNESGSEEELVLQKFEYYAGNTGGPVTPFIVTVHGDDDFTVKAIGQTVVPSDLGINSVPFSDSSEATTITLAANEKIAVGFIDAYANGDSGPDPKAIVAGKFTGGTDEIYYVGASEGKVASLTVGAAPELFVAPRDAGARDYAFSVLMTKSSNSLPYFLNIPDETANVGASVDLQTQAFDQNDDEISFSAAGLPVGLSINPTTGKITGTPTAAGTFEVIVIATDIFDGVGSTSFTWTINDPGSSNTLPTLTNPTELNNHTEETVEFTLDASDANGGTLTFTATNLPPGLALNGANGKITGQPTQLGTYFVSVLVADGQGGSAGIAFKWHINEPPNSPPTINNPGDQTGEVGETTTLNVSGSDVNGDSIRFSATGLPSGLAIDPTGKIAGTFTQDGTFVVNITADDGQDENSSSTISFTWIVDPSATTVHVIGNAAEPRSKADDWKSNIVINESDLFTNTDSSAVQVEISTVTYYAATANAPVTPFVVTVHGDNDFTVRAIGDTHFASAIGAQSTPFKSGGKLEILVQPGEKLAVGFIDAEADGSYSGSAQSVVTFDENEADEVWYVGLPTGQVASLTVGEEPETFATVRHSLRNYAFAIALITTNGEPPDYDNKIYMPFVTR